MINAMVQLVDRPDARLHIAVWAGPGAWRTRCGYFGEMRWPTQDWPLPAWAADLDRALTEHQFWNGHPTGRVLILRWVTDITEGHVCHRCAVGWKADTDAMAYALAQLGAFEPTTRS